MTEWAPATDAEVAMRDALRTDDQESYFRILAGVDLLLPVSADALAGLAPLGWGTWSTGGRTHVLAFTSPSALQACLADYTGSARRVAYAELADTWPNLEWWLAVNPGLPIEGYLPAWFVAQLSRGDLRLPTRGPAREGGAATASPQDLQAAVLAANAAASQGGGTPGESSAGLRPVGAAGGDPRRGLAQSLGDARRGSPQTAGDPRRGSAQSGGPSFGPGEAAAFAGQSDPGGAGDRMRPGFGGPAAGGPNSGGPSIADLRRGVSADSARPAAASGGPGSGTTGPGAAGAGGAPVGPGGLPVRTPGAVLPSGLPSRVPSTPAGDLDTSSFPGFSTRGGPAETPGSSVPAAYQAPGVPGGVAPSSGVPAAYRPPGVPGAAPSAPAPSGPAADGSSAFGRGPGQSGSAADRSAVGSAFNRGSLGSPPGSADSGFDQGGSAPGVGRGGLGAALGRGAGGAPPGQTAGQGGLSSAFGQGAGPSQPAGQGGPSPASLQDPRGPLPTRTPMAQTPPLPSHIPAPDTDRQPDWDPPDGLPRRPITAPSERPSSMAAAAQALAGTPAPQSAPPPTSFGIMPPVIPGAGGLARSGPGRLPTEPPVLPNIPPTSPGPTAGPYDQGGPDRDQWEPDPNESGAADTVVVDDFVAANDVERDLLDAAGEHSTDRFLSTLLLAEVLVPVEHNSRPGSSPGEAGFVFRTEEIEGERFLVVFTSRDRLAEHFAEPTRTVGVRFLELIRNWPDPAWSFAINPESPVGAKYPGPQVIALASWATDAGLGADPVDVDDRPSLAVPAPQKVSDAAQHATVMQKTVPAEQVDYYLERGYDRVAGFVHRASEVEHLHTPAELFGGLGLVHESSPYQADAKEAYVLRWPAYRPSLYRIPYGGQSEQALRAMDGWVIERPPFRGNGFAPGEGRDVIAEFKVDSVRLPHGAQLWRMDADGTERMIAIFDGDAPTWRRVGEQ